MEVNTPEQEIACPCAPEGGDQIIISPPTASVGERYTAERVFGYLRRVSLGLEEYADGTALYVEKEEVSPVNKAARECAAKIASDKCHKWALLYDNQGVRLFLRDLLANMSSQSQKSNTPVEVKINPDFL